MEGRKNARFVNVQNCNFAPNCIVRGSRTVPICPNARLVTFKLVKPLKFVWLKILKASARSWSERLSLKRTFLDNVKSKRVVPGPSMTPRPAVPGVFCKPVAPAGGFLWKQEVSNHLSTVCGAFLLGSQRKLGLAGIQRQRIGMSGSRAQTG